MKSFLMLALALVFGSCGACQKIEAKRTQKLIGVALASSVHVECGYDKDGDGEADAGGFGSGAVIAPGKIITAGHVTTSCIRARGANPNDPVGITVHGDGWASDVFRAEISIVADIAILSAETPAAIPSVTFSDVDQIRGDFVEIFGGVPGFERQVITGLVARPKDEENFVVTSAHCQPGWSGGPVFNSDGLAVGIVLATLIEGGGPCLFLSVKNVIESAGTTVVFDAPPEVEKCECK
jgi:S1-C subfamily serine protease